MPETVPIDDDQPKDGAGEDATETDDEDDDGEIQWAKLQLERLDSAIGFVLQVVPPYGATNENTGTSASDDVPPSIDLVRRRALIAAYGLIEREFSPQQGGVDEDA